MSTTEPSASQPPSGVARRCIAVTVLVALAASIPFALRYDRTRLSDSVFVAKYTDQRRYDVVFVGDSRVMFGVDPMVVEGSSRGIAATNFGFQGAGIDGGILDHAKRLVDPDSPVRLLAIGVSRLSLSQESNADNSYLEVTRMTPIERANLLAFARFEPYLHIQPAHFLNRQRSWFKVTAGGHVSATFPTDTEAHTKRDERRARIPATWVDQATVEQLARWISTARKDGTRIAVFRVPTSPKMAEIETDRLKLDVAGLRRRFEAAGAVWIDTPLSDPTLRSYDGSHLDGASSERFTAMLAERLRARRLLP